MPRYIYIYIAYRVKIVVSEVLTNTVYKARRVGSQRAKLIFVKSDYKIIKLNFAEILYVEGYRNTYGSI